jgi:hypothetical protein
MAHISKNGFFPLVLWISCDSKFHAFSDFSDNPISDILMKKRLPLWFSTQQQAESSKRAGKEPSE